jgi:hypothetical protein
MKRLVSLVEREVGEADQIECRVYKLVHAAYSLADDSPILSSRLGR